jgi:arylsulfatase A
MSEAGCDVWWPGKIKASSKSNQTVCLTDIMATAADITGFVLPENSAEGSFSLFPALLGKDKGAIRPYTLHQTWTLGMAIRRGKWKYLDHKGSAGSRYHRGGPWGMKDYALEEKAPNAPGQLYDLEKDPGETNNLYFKQPEIVKELKAILEETKKSGRSRPATQ